MQKQSMQPVSVVVPTLNEVENLPLLFDRIHATLSAARIPYEIIVVDDHSTDGTAEFVRKAAGKFNARLQIKQGERGKAFSLLEGFATAEHEIICMIDADLQYPPEAMKLMYHKLQYLGADIVLTNRVENKTSILRKISTKVFNLLFTRLLFGIKYDTQSGLKMFRKDVLSQITLTPSAWTFDLEFIVRALENDFVIVSQDIPFSERNAGVPKIKMLDATMEIAGGSLKLWRTTSTKRIKLRYKYLESMQNKAWLMIGLIVGMTCLLAIPAQKVSADSLRQLEKELTSTKVDISGITGLTTISPTATTTVPVLTSPVTSLLSTPITTATPGTISGTTTSSSPTTSDNPISTTTTLTPAAATSSTTSAKSSSTDTGSTAAVAPTTTSGTIDQSGQNAAYYNSGKLSTSVTSLLKDAARGILAVAGILLVGGLLVYAVMSLTNRIHRLPLRN